MQSEASATGNELGLQFLRREIWLNCNNPNCVPTNPCLLWGEGRTDLAVFVLRDGEIGHLVDLEAVGVGNIDFLLSSPHGERLEICGKEDDDDDEGTGGESERWESFVHAICSLYMQSAGELRGAVVVVETGDWGASGRDMEDWRADSGAMILGRVPEHDAGLFGAVSLVQETIIHCLEMYYRI